MMRWFFLLSTLSIAGCGYKAVQWSSPDYQTVEIAPVKVQGIGEGHQLSFRLRDALVTRFLANSGLKPVTENGDLVLQASLQNVGQSTLATGTDGRTERLQLALNASFELFDITGARLWHLDNYRYTDQIQVSTTSQNYRDETVLVQEEAVDAVAALVVNNVTLVISEQKKGQ